MDSFLKRFSHQITNFFLFFIEEQIKIFQNIQYSGDFQQMNQGNFAGLLEAFDAASR